MHTASRTILLLYPVWKYALQLKKFSGSSVSGHPYTDPKISSILASRPPTPADRPELLTAERFLLNIPTHQNHWAKLTEHAPVRSDGSVTLTSRLDFVLECLIVPGPGYVGSKVEGSFLLMESGSSLPWWLDRPSGAKIP